MARHISIKSNLFRHLLTQNKSLHLRTMASEQPVLFDTINNVGVITLNRPKVLNALNLEMVDSLTPKLKEWETKRSFVIIKGAGEKAFCAGGDIKAVTESGLAGGRYGHDFFNREYTLNGIIGTYGIPYVAIIDGIVMGGGVGLSVHGPYRVATERTLFAMPETAIGLFPDVGGSHFLPRLGGKLGRYLALTGFRLKGSDTLKAGVATHFVESQNLQQLEKSLLECKNESDIRDALSKYSVSDSKEFCLKPVLDKINTCFAGNTMENIMLNLEKEGSEWALQTIETLKKMCPTSLKVTVKQLDLGKNMSLQKCLQMEYRIAVHCMKNKNFYEGVRALLIDKDQQPKWMPSTLAEVTEDFVEGHFSKLSDEEELKHKL